MRIRAVEVGDAGQTMELLNGIIATGVETSMGESLTLEEQEAYIAGFPAEGVCLVAEEAGQVIAMQGIEPCRDGAGEISTFVAAGCRGRGVGRALAAELFAQAEAKGFRTLVAVIRADNVRARAFYGALGFVEAGRRQCPYRGGFLDQVVAELTLAGRRSGRKIVRTPSAGR